MNILSSMSLRVLSLTLCFLFLFLFSSFFLFLSCVRLSPNASGTLSLYFFYHFCGLSRRNLYFIPFLSFCLFSFVPILKTLASTCYFLCLVSQPFFISFFSLFGEPLFPLYLFLSFYSSPVSLFFFRLSQPYL